MIAPQLLSDTDRGMTSVNITSMCIASDIAIAEYNQAGLGKLEVRTTNSV